MTETAADEQDLAKALDSVANAATNLSSSSPVQPDTSGFNSLGGSGLPPIVPLNSPVAPAPVEPTLPPVTPLEDPAPEVHSVHDGAGMAYTDGTSDNSSSSDDNSNNDSSNSDSTPAPSRDDAVSSTDTVPSGPLADIKSDALNELRPLVDKLNVSAEEKFDTYLLLIRSTDDTSLIAPAHEAAKAIEDEAKRAEALLDIIKEIDYLSRQDKQDN